MKRPGFDGGFLLCFLLNLVFTAFWALPSIVLFILHFAIGTPAWLGWAALGIWIVVILAITAFMSWAASTSATNAAGTGMPGKATTRFSSQGTDSPRLHR